MRNPPKLSAHFPFPLTSMAVIPASFQNSGYPTEKDSFWPHRQGTLASFMNNREASGLLGVNYVLSAARKATVASHLLVT